MSDYTADDLAAEFGCSRDYVMSQARKGSWPHYRVAQRYLFTAEDLEQIKAIQRPKPADPAPADTWGQKTRRAS